MKALKKNQQALLIIAPLLCISMMILVPVLTSTLGKTIGYITGFFIYWLVFCIPATIYASNGFAGLKEMYVQRTEMPKSKRMAYYFLALIPCIATFFVVFKGFALIAGFQVLILALLFALINGTIEELFWRGAFNKVFKNVYFAYIYPSIFFGIWHIALFYAKGMEYQGGFTSLVGGATFLGLLWGFVAYKTKSIRVVTVAHIITNFFAFTGLIFENW
ncbi:Abortive infection protein [Petrocella atlantisensis]|uniref:Abortive infection protein n=1 Tax=Petrocella atlantisensis TaxID=2173034 RepID=A0A3P7PCN6_9FIRM|nr:CPBP family intramembrane glutamic endopeptidase [Petrocella atlantisensis]VDN46648.1 Abortive infection protein [Petrocella atlantisensis]